MNRWKPYKPLWIRNDSIAREVIYKYSYLWYHIKCPIENMRCEDYPCNKCWTKYYPAKREGNWGKK
jgi:hypothetical protein